MKRKHSGPPCEVAVKEVLPAVRSMLAEILLSKNVSLYRVSKVLGITPAAVENYVKKKRGTALREYLEKDVNFMEMLNEVADKIISDETVEFANYYCVLCTESKKALKKSGLEYPACYASGLL
ncbi:MAG: transcriptional regulator [Thermoprotei archaeon]